MPSERELFLSHATRALPQQHYLASPFSAESAELRADYVEASRQAGEKLRRDGYVVYCPLLVGDGKTPRYGWYHYDLAHLRDCKGGLFVLPLPGWEESFGVALEIAAMLALERPVTMLDVTASVDPELVARIQRRRRERQPAAEPHRIVTDFLSGMSVDKICANTGVSHEEACATLRDHLKSLSKQAEPTAGTIAASTLGEKP